MNLKLLSLIALLLFTMKVATAQKTKASNDENKTFESLPDAVKKSFSAKNSADGFTSWYKNGTVYKLYFDKTRTSYFYKANGEWVKTQKLIDANEFPDKEEFNKYCPDGKFSKLCVEDNSSGKKYILIQNNSKYIFNDKGKFEQEAELKKMKSRF